MQQIFERIYEKELWGKGKGSGTGSSPNYCRKYIDFIEKKLQENQYGVVIDFGCGDWQLGKAIDWRNGNRYFGCDVVESVVHGAKKQADELTTYEDGFFKFEVLDFSNKKELAELLHFYRDYNPLILCKDVLQHWPDEYVHMFLQTLEDCVAPGAESIITNNWRHIRSPEKNGTPRDVNNKYRWAPIDLTLDPFAGYGYEVGLFYPRKEKMVCTKVHN